MARAVGSRPAAGVSLALGQLSEDVCYRAFWNKRQASLLADCRKQAAALRRRPSGPSHLCVSTRVCGGRSLVLQGAASLTRETKVRNRDTVSHLRQKLTVGTQTWCRSPVGAAEIEKRPWRAWASLAVRPSVQISFILPETWSTDLFLSLKKTYLLIRQICECLPRAKRHPHEPGTQH